ncbi:hypothetical protein HDV00_005433 [Rhizophlyctis rosea]|nr:hypothetical protein HDV00_005433 [Rhizophlyctis rosea]
MASLEVPPNDAHPPVGPSSTTLLSSPFPRPASGRSSLAARFNIPDSLRDAVSAVDREKEEHRASIAKGAAAFSQTTANATGDIRSVPLMSVTGSSLEQARLARLASFTTEAREREKEVQGGRERESRMEKGSIQTEDKDKVPSAGMEKSASRLEGAAAAQRMTPQMTLVETYISRLTAPRILVSERKDHIRWEKRGLRELLLKEKLTNQVMELEKQVGELVVEIGKCVDERTALEREVGDRKRYWEKMEPILLGFFRLHHELTERRAQHIDHMMMLAAQANAEARASTANIMTEGGKAPPSRLRARNRMHVGLMAANLAAGIGGRSQHLGSRDFGTGEARRSALGLDVGGAEKRSHMTLNEGVLTAARSGSGASTFGLNDGGRGGFTQRGRDSLSLGMQMESRDPQRSSFALSEDAYPTGKARDSQGMPAEAGSPKTLSKGSSKGLGAGDSVASLRGGMVGEQRGSESQFSFNVVIDSAE